MAAAPTSSDAISALENAYSWADARTVNTWRPSDVSLQLIPTDQVSDSVKATLPKVSSSLSRITRLFTGSYNYTLKKVGWRPTDPRSMQALALDPKCPLFSFITNVKSYEALSLHPGCMAEIAKYHRQSADGPFRLDSAASKLLDTLQSLGGDYKDFSSEDLMGSCSPKQSLIYRDFLDKFLNAKRIAAYGPALENMARESTLKMAREIGQKSSTNFSEHCQLLAAETSSQFLTGSSEASEIIAKACKCWDSPESSQEEKARALQGLLDLDRHTSPRSLLGAMSRDSQFTPLQVKGMAVSLVLNSCPTMGVLMTYLLMQMHLNNKVRRQLRHSTWYYREIGLLDAVWEGLRLCPPHYSLSRELKGNTYAVFLNEKTQEKALVILQEGSKVSGCPFAAGRSEDYFSSPERFSPERHSNEKINQTVKPFGEGAHACPGRLFALLACKALLKAFLDNCVIGSEIKEEIPQVGHATTQLKEDFCGILNSLSS